MVVLVKLLQDLMAVQVVELPVRQVPLTIAIMEMVVAEHHNLAVEMVAHQSTTQEQPAHH